MKALYFIIGLIVIILIFLFSSVFTVNQTQQGILLRLGKIQKSSTGQPLILEPGLHFKTPFVTTVRRFDMRLQTLTIDSSRIVTAEQKDVLVDAFVKWRINNIVKFYTSTGGDYYRADALLRQKVLDGLRAEFGKETILELVSGQRTQVMKVLQEASNKVAQPLGVTITDVRIKRIDLPDEVTGSVFSRMRSDREKEASLIRAQGKEKAEQIKSEADAQVTILMSKARAQSAVIKAKGVAEAAKIYADTYSKDANFYDFYRSLQAYQTSFMHQKDVFVLNPQGRFFKYFGQNTGGFAAK